MNRLLIVYQLDNSCISLREIQEAGDPERSRGCGMHLRREDVS